MNTFTLALLTMTVLVTAACKTNQRVAVVDEHRRHIEVYSSQDGKSAMLDASKDARFNRAVQDLEARVKQEPRDLAALANLAQLYLVQERFDESEATSRQILRLDIKNNDAKRVLAQVSLRRGNPEMATIILNSMDEQALKDSQTLNLLAMVALHEKKPEHAMAYFKEALKANPSDAAVRMNLGVLYLKHRQLASAAVQFERILRSMPEHIDAKMHLAVIKAARGENSEAEKIYRDVLRQQDKNPLALYNLAVVQKRMQRHDSALDNLKAYLQTPYARSSNTENVFALIEAIQSDKAARGERVSDDDIQRLAAQIRSEPRQQSSRAPTVGPATSEVAPIQSQGRGGRVDEILELERQLMVE